MDRSTRCKPTATHTPFCDRQTSTDDKCSPTVQLSGDAHVNPAAAGMVLHAKKRLRIVDVLRTINKADPGPDRLSGDKNDRSACQFIHGKAYRDPKTRLQILSSHQEQVAGEVEKRGEPAWVLN